MGLISRVSSRTYRLDKKNNKKMSINYHHISPRSRSNSHYSESLSRTQVFTPRADELQDDFTAFQARMREIFDYYEGPRRKWSCFLYFDYSFYNNAYKLRLRRFQKISSQSISQYFRLLTNSVVAQNILLV